MKRVFQIMALLLALGAMIQTAVSATESKKLKETTPGRSEPGI